MSVVVTGANGQLGRALRSYLPTANFLTRSQLNIGNPADVERFRWHGVEIIINASAYTDVDGAETEEGRKQAYLINALGTVNLAKAAKEFNIILVQISSDYVFNGRSTTPYQEGNLVSPQSVYGRSKLASESVVQELSQYYVVRTSAVYFEGGRNFPAAILRKALAGGPLAVVDYQVVRPTYASDLARTIVRLCRNKAPFGVYHCQNSGQPVTWYEYAKTVLELAGLKNEVQPLDRVEFEHLYPQSAQRPDYSVLDLAKLEYYGISMVDWLIALSGALPRLRQTVELSL